MPSGSSVVQSLFLHSADRVSIAELRSVVSASTGEFAVACSASRKVMNPSNVSCSPMEGTRGLERSVLIFQWKPTTSPDPDRRTKSFEGCVSKRNCPPRIIKLASDEGSLAEGMYPFGQVMEVLTIPVPLKPVV